MGDRRTLFEVLLGLYQILISREQFEATAPVVEDTLPDEETWPVLLDT